MNDTDYINLRRRQAQELSELFYKYQNEKIVANKIVFSTFEGDGGFCCNPRYIVEELLKRKEEYDIVWLTHDPSKHDFPKGVKTVEDSAENTAFHLSTAKVWIDNYRKPWGTIKREGQIYLQTWHASIGFKAVGLYRGSRFPEIARIVSQADSELIDTMIINSEYCRQVYPKKILYDGNMLKVGSPRVDCLINNRDDLHSRLRKKYGLTHDVQILLYAPTFRGGTQKGKKQVISETPSINFQMVINELEKKTGAKWYIFLRLHPQLSAKLESMPISDVNDRLIDVSQEEDMSQVLGASDLLVTDYSSCAFDAMYAKIPVLLYADDVNEYVQNRGQFMWKKEELPFQITENNKELVKSIRGFEQLEYEKKVALFIDKHGIVEDGKASSKVADYIEGLYGRI